MWKCCVVNKTDHPRPKSPSNSLDWYSLQPRVKVHLRFETLFIRTTDRNPNWRGSILTGSTFSAVAAFLKASDLGLDGKNVSPLTLTWCLFICWCNTAGFVLVTLESLRFTFEQNKNSNKERGNKKEIDEKISTHNSGLGCQAQVKSLGLAERKLWLTSSLPKTNFG